MCSIPAKFDFILFIDFEEFFFYHEFVAMQFLGINCFKLKDNQTSDLSICVSGSVELLPVVEAVRRQFLGMKKFHSNIFP